LDQSVLNEAAPSIAPKWHSSYAHAPPFHPDHFGATSSSFRDRFVHLAARERNGAESARLPSHWSQLPPPTPPVYRILKWHQPPRTSHASQPELSSPSSPLPLRSDEAAPTPAPPLPKQAAQAEEPSPLEATPPHTPLVARTARTSPPASRALLPSPTPQRQLEYRAAVSQPACEFGSLSPPANLRCEHEWSAMEQLKLSLLQKPHRQQVRWSHSVLGEKKRAPSEPSVLPKEEAREGDLMLELLKVLSLPRLLKCSRLSTRSHAQEQDEWLRDASFPSESL
ncbi:MAG: hypothetical protein SGPRY_010859, partial [Prymnesium sp.]